jgi:hypothetical protein
VAFTGKQVKQFRELFSGLNRAYGLYELGNPKFNETEKQSGRAKTVHEPLPKELWREHLTGKTGLGIVPIRDDNTVTWCAIDIDTYPVDHREIAKKLEDSNIQGNVFRSKSGGAHVFFFLEENIPAKIAQDVLRRVASSIGYGKTEIFSKQTELVAERGDVGNWINLPYFNEAETERYLVHPERGPIIFNEAVDYLQSRIVPVEIFSNWYKNIVNELLPDGPPCLNFLVPSGIPKGSRNNGLFNMGVYARKAHEEEWEKHLEEYNKKHIHPPLDSKEVQAVIKSLKRKDYAYTCNRDPIQSHCNSILCRQKPYGIVEDSGLPKLGGLTKLLTKPPIWFLDVDGTRMELDTEDLQSQSKFQKRCMDYLNTMPSLMKQTIWRQTVQDLLENVHEIEVPEDATPAGQFWAYLEQFCTGRAQAKFKEDLLLGKPWLNTEDNCHYFRLRDVMQFLYRLGFKELSRAKITSILRDRGARHAFFNIRGHGTNVWKLINFNQDDQ